MTHIQPNKIRRYTCARWSEFIEKVRVERFAGDRIFRGQRDCNWGLSSAWDRFLNRMRGGDKSRNIRKVFDGGSYNIMDQMTAHLGHVYERKLKCQRLSATFRIVFAGA